MKTYQLSNGDTLVVSINGTAWESVVFEKKDFGDIGAATAEEVAAVLNRNSGLNASVDEGGDLILATSAAGGHATLEVDLANSTAASKLGLGVQQASATGAGVSAARLVSSNTEPFALASGSEMTLVVDGSRRRVLFDEGFTNNKATAEEVAKIINAKKKKVADATRDGRVLLVSNTVGPGSSLKVEPAPADKKDAAEALGFVGATAFDEPTRIDPARIACRGPQQGIEAVNLTASPIELHLPSGNAILPASSAVLLSASDAASSQLQHLIGTGSVRLATTIKE